MAAGLIMSILRKGTVEWSSLTQSKKVHGDFIVADRNKLTRNPTWGGLGTITGTVKIGSAPAKRRVRLYEASTGVLIQEKWANDDGTYSFVGVVLSRRYTVTSTDYNNNYDDVIAANVTPV